MPDTKDNTQAHARRSKGKSKRGAGMPTVKKLSDAVQKVTVRKPGTMQGLPSQLSGISANTPSRWQLPDGYAQSRPIQGRPMPDLSGGSIPYPPQSGDQGGVQPPEGYWTANGGTSWSGEQPVRRRRAQPVPPPVPPQNDPPIGIPMRDASPLPPINDPHHHDDDSMSFKQIARAYFDYWKRWIILGGVVILAIIIMISVSNSLKQQRAYNELVEQVHAYDDLFCEGVYVDGIHLGGMTQQEAWDAVAAQAADYLSRWSVKLTFEGETITTVNAQTLSLSLDPTDALNAAWAQGRDTSGSPEAVLAAREQLKEETFHAYSVEPDIDLSVLDVLLEDLSAQLYLEPQDASIASFDAARTYPFTFNEEIRGRELDLTTLKSQLVEMLQEKSSGTIELQAAYTDPKITVEYLKANVICEMATVYT